MTIGEMWDAKAIGKISAGTGPSFLSILDKYTAVGIYLIHHTFTLTELFAMGAFSLVETTLNAGITLADESVRTSTASLGPTRLPARLLRFITLCVVRSTTIHAFPTTTPSLSSTSSRKRSPPSPFFRTRPTMRSAKSMKMRVVYDCTVLGEVEAKSWRSLMVGSGYFIRSRPAALLASAAEGFETLSIRSPPRRTASLHQAHHSLPASASGANFPRLDQEAFLATVSA